MYSGTFIMSIKVTASALDLFFEPTAWLLVRVGHWGLCY
jgi:hypothetical protein